MSESIGPVVPLTKDGRVECAGCHSKCAVGGGEYIGLNKEGGFYHCYVCGEKWPKPEGCTCNTFDTGYHMSTCKFTITPPTAPESCPKCGHPPCKSKVCLGHCIDQISGSMVICDCDCQSPTLPSTPAETGRWKPGMCVAHLEFNCRDYGKYDGKHNVSAMFEDCLPEVQRALNGKSDEVCQRCGEHCHGELECNDIVKTKSDEKWERLLAMAMELLKDAAPCDLETVNLDEQAWWNKLNHLKAELESSKLQMVDGLPVRKGDLT